jgi:hypothetical protein
MPGASLDVHAADSKSESHFERLAGSLKKSNTPCCEQLIKTLEVN